MRELKKDSQAIARERKLNEEESKDIELQERNRVRKILEVEKEEFKKWKT